MHHALYLAPFGELSEPRRLMDLAVAAEDNGWDGLFLWDHVLRPSADPQQIVDPWICLAAAAAVTDRIRLGPLVTPLIRRRPIKLGREVMTLDRLSSGRVTLGIGLGVDSGGELTRFGEVVDAKERGAMLDEGLPVLASLLAGERVTHRGPSYTVDDITMEPPTVQRPRPPIWLASRGDARRPVRRAAGYEGLFPIEVDPKQLAAALDLVATERGSLDGFDVAVVDASPTPSPTWASYAEAGATWRLATFRPSSTFDAAMAAASAPPE